MPVFKKSVKSIYTELGGNRPNKHESTDTLTRHLPKNQRFLGKDVVREFAREGYLVHHRTNTYSLTKSGESFCKKVLSGDLFGWLTRTKRRFGYKRTIKPVEPKAVEPLCLGGYPPCTKEYFVGSRSIELQASAWFLCED